MFYKCELLLNSFLCILQCFLFLLRLLFIFLLIKVIWDSKVITEFLLVSNPLKFSLLPKSHSSEWHLSFLKVLKFAFLKSKYCHSTVSDYKGLWIQVSISPKHSQSTILMTNSLMLFKESRIALFWRASCTYKITLTIRKI